MAGTALILGARNLGRAIAERLSASGWNVATVARSQETVTIIREAIPDALALALELHDPASVEDVARRTRERFGSLELIVNAVTPGMRDGGGSFGGGPLLEAAPEDLDHYATAVARQVFAFLSGGGRALRESGAGTLIQITGGSSRHVNPGRGPWAAGAFATRALTETAALELREQSIHVALLVVDATIRSPKTAARMVAARGDEVAEQTDVAAAVEYLAGQAPSAWSHELVITPRGERFVP